MTMPKGWNTNQNNTSQYSFGPETVIWKNEVMTGIFNRKVVEVQIITNLRVLQNDRAIALSELDDIIVMNQHRESQFQGGRYYVRGSGMSYGTGRSTGKSVGDVAFIYQGQPNIVFKKIADPSGVVRLAKAARRSMLQQIKLVAKQQAKHLKEQEKQRKIAERQQNQLSSKRNSRIIHNGTTEITQSEIRQKSSEQICQNCQNSNPVDATYCGMCGIRLPSKCSQCGQGNPTGASFCNACGFALT